MNSANNIEDIREGLTLRTKSFCLIITRQQISARSAYPSNSGHVTMALFDSFYSEFKA